MLASTLQEEKTNSTHLAKCKIYNSVQTDANPSALSHKQEIDCKAKNMSQCQMWHSTPKRTDQRQGMSYLEQKTQSCRGNLCEQPENLFIRLDKHVWLQDLPAEIASFTIFRSYALTTSSALLESVRCNLVGSTACFLDSLSGISIDSTEPEREAITVRTSQLLPSGPVLVSTTQEAVMPSSLFLHVHRECLSSPQRPFSVTNVVISKE